MKEKLDYSSHTHAKSPFFCFFTQIRNKHKENKYKTIVISVRKVLFSFLFALFCFVLLWCCCYHDVLFFFFLFFFSLFVYYIHKNIQTFNVLIFAPIHENILPNSYVKNNFNIYRLSIYSGSASKPPSDNKSFII